MNFEDNSNFYSNDIEEYLSDDYNPNDFSSEEPKENKFIKGIIDNSLEKKGFKFNKSVDVRIVLTDFSFIESISATINNFDLTNFNVVISSIIPTNDLEIAKSTTQGADLLLIATEYNEDGKNLFYQFKDELKTDFNYVEYLKLPEDNKPESTYHAYSNNYKKEDLTEFFEDEIANSIIRAGLSCVSNLSIINHSKLNFFQIKEDYDKTNQKLEKTNLENTHLNNEAKALRDKNEKLSEEVLILQKELDKLKSDYSTYKSKFDNIYTRDSLEIFDINQLWLELFDSYLSSETYEAIILATNDFQPSDVIVGQGFIGAKTKEDAFDWLKIIKTALIVNFGDFEPSKNSSVLQTNTYHQEENNFRRDFNNSNDDLDNGFNVIKKDFKDSDDLGDDIEIPNVFSNMW